MEGTATITLAEYNNLKEYKRAYEELASGKIRSFASFSFFDYCPPKFLHIMSDEDFLEEINNFKTSHDIDLRLLREEINQLKSRSLFERILNNQP